MPEQERPLAKDRGFFKGYFFWPCIGALFYAMKILRHIIKSEIECRMQGGLCPPIPQNGGLSPPYQMNIYNE
jgi:hypothetical protein